MANVSQQARTQTYNTVMRNDISQIVYLYIPTENEVIRDKFKDIVGKGLNYIELHSHPTNINPSQKTLDKLGIKEPLNAVFNITKQEYEEKVGLDPVDIIRYRIGFEIQIGVMRYYEISIGNYHGAVASGQFRYVVLAGNEVT
jgi:hypothetical protein